MYMSTEAHRRRATSTAGFLTDPTSKKDSFYHLMKLKASKYGKEVGVEIVLKKSTMLPWVEDYLYSVYKQELPLYEEKALVRKDVIINYILKHCLPNYTLDLISLRSDPSSDPEQVLFQSYCYMGKVPKRSTGGTS